NLPVHASGVAHMLADGPSDLATVARVAQALALLEQMSLVFRMPDGGAWVHRWTAEGLARSQPGDLQGVRWARAGRYRRWRAQHDSHDLKDLIEAVRNFLRAKVWDDATKDAATVTEALGRFHQTIVVVSFVAEVLAALPDDHHSVPTLLGVAG